VTEKKRFRGYISSRPFDGERAPQHIQNLVIRTYCEDLGFEFLLSATEVAMPNSYLVLNRLITEIEELDGVVFYSLRQLPEEPHHRRKIFHEVLAARREVHFSVERLAIQNNSDVNRVENILGVAALLPQIPDIRTWYRAKTHGK
tara:strand:+ start:96 stop:530 length:435 start_codon:yes stop_codon:yes gene_type:complete